jgi:hypothetical protein
LLLDVHCFPFLFDLYEFREKPIRKRALKSGTLNPVQQAARRRNFAWVGKLQRQLKAWFPRRVHTWLSRWRIVSKRVGRISGGKRAIWPGHPIKRNEWHTTINSTHSFAGAKQQSNVYVTVMERDEADR